MIDSVKVGVLRYAVRLVEDLRDDEGKGLNGWIRHDPCLIQIEAKLNPQVQKVCAIHEALHGWATQAGLAQDEVLIDSFAYGMYGLLRDNPALVAWLCEGDGDAT